MPRSVSAVSERRGSTDSHTTLAHAAGAAVGALLTRLGGRWRSAAAPARGPRSLKGVEQLESRVLLTTFTGGGEQNGVALPGQSFDYRDANDNRIRIQLNGNITAEFLGLLVDGGDGDSTTADGDGPNDDNSTRLVDMVRYIPAAGNNPGNAGFGADLFSIYVAQSDALASISVVQVPANGQGTIDLPFAGSIGNIRVTDAQSGQENVVAISGGTGVALLGARTKALALTNPPQQGPDLGDVLILNRGNSTQRGVRPPGRVYAGLEIAPNQQFGRFYFGGTVTGRVRINGSIDEFYAGNVFTGEANSAINNGGPQPFGDSGISALQAPSDPNNFFVAGDIRQLIVGDSIGTEGINAGGDPETGYSFKSGFSMRVKGRLGSVTAHGSFLGGAIVENGASIKYTGAAQTEREIREGAQGSVGVSAFEGLTTTGLPSLADQPAFNNDTFSTAELLGSRYDKVLRADAIDLNGTINTIGGDGVDYYGVALLAGQTITVQLTSLDGLALNAAIYDPDGRQVATDYSHTGAATGLPFRYTTLTPGEFRIAVAVSGDGTFSGAGGGGGQGRYNLTVKNVGSLAWGGIEAGGAIASFDLGGISFELDRGDFGILSSIGTSVGGSTTSVGGGIFADAQALPYLVNSGNLRAIQGDSIGFATVGGLSESPNLHVPHGNVGLVRLNSADPTSTSGLTGGVLALNLPFVTPGTGAFLVTDAIGGSYQLVDATGGTFVANLLTDVSVGVIRGDAIGSDALAPRIAVNADNRGTDGVIDLIYSAGDIGTAAAGGPIITTGPGGNVRYMHVGAGNTAFRDAFFGGTSPNETTYTAGEPVTLNDDSGTQFTISPLPTTSPFPGTTTDVGGTLTILTFGIRDKAGIVPVRIEDSDLAATGSSIEISTRASGRLARAEIGQLIVDNDGTDVSYSELTNAFTSDPTGNNNAVRLRGGGRLDVFDLSSVGASGTGASGFTTVSNETPGEIVNIDASSIGQLSANTVGLATSRTGTEVSGAVNAAATAAGYPFNRTRNLIHLSGGTGSFSVTPAGSTVATNFITQANLANASIRGGIGPVLVEGGNVGFLSINSDKKHSAGQFDGISQPIVATDVSGTPTPQVPPVVVPVGSNVPVITNQGNLVAIQIGEGLLPSGSGNVGGGGLYAGGAVIRVNNQGAGSDIRGDIIAVNGIGSIDVRDGSIVGSDILQVDTFDQGEEFAAVGATPVDTPITAPVFQIGSVSVKGNGGILGSLIVGANVGKVSAGGFGFLGSVISVAGPDVAAGITADGYGIRSSTIGGGTNVQRVSATGNGKLLLTTSFESTVRNSEGSAFDPYTGQAVNAANDLHVFLGTTKARPRRTDASEAGVIADSTIIGQRDLERVDAWRIIGHNANVVPPSDPAFPMLIRFSNSTGTITVRDKIDGLQIVTGSLGTLSAKSDVAHAYLSVAGRIGKITSQASLLSTTTINATGAEGRIDTIDVDKRLNATVQVSLDVNHVEVGTDFGSTRFDVGRNVKLFHITDSAVAGTNVHVSGTLVTLQIDNDVQAGATIRARRLLNQIIGGDIAGDIITG